MRQSVALRWCLVSLLLLASGMIQAPLSAEFAPASPVAATSGRKVLLTEVPGDIAPAISNLWKCSCDSDGCWPGCFTVASAVVMKYWATKGYSNIWGADDNDGLYKLRDVLPNMLCYGNGNGNGKPGDTGYDANDVAGGLREWAAQHGYAFKVTPVIRPSFDEIVREIDSGRPVIAAFGESPWGSHAGTVVGYDTTNDQRKFIVRPNFFNVADVALSWNAQTYKQFSMVLVEPSSPREQLRDLPPLNFDVTVTNRDASFAMNGGWLQKLGYGHTGEAMVVWSPEAGTDFDGEEDPAWARWSPALPFDGMWEIMAWMPTSSEEPDANLTRQATYRINHAEGLALSRRSQQDAVQGWLSLGVFPFKKGAAAQVLLGNRTGESLPVKLWADAMKFSWRSPLLLQPESDPRQTFIVLDGTRYRVPENDTFAALRLNPALARKVPDVSLAQYPIGDQLPSIYTSWVGQYFNNTNLSPPASVVRADAHIDFRWSGAAPAPNMSELGYSVRWSRLLALTEGNYTFKIDSVGGLRLWVDGRLAIDAWDAADNVLLAHEGSANLKTGLHRVDIEYVNRTGLSQITLGNLPPSTPLLNDASSPSVTRAQTVDLKWIDTGDPDASTVPRKFYASVWRAGDNWQINSDWITSTQWTVPIPTEGRYFFRVAASDGQATSDFSPTRQFIVDRTPPWSQMKSAAARNAGAFDPISGKVLSPTLAKVAGIDLVWEGSDIGAGASGVAGYDLQTRETIHAGVQVEAVTKFREKTAIKYELYISGTQEITRGVLITQLVPYSSTSLLRTFVPVSGTWTTITTGLASTHTVFVGSPGSAYEFRVRARDVAGNQQLWYDGYGVQAQEDPNEVVSSQP